MNRRARLLVLAFALGCAKTPLGESSTPDAAAPADATTPAPELASNGVPIPDVPAHAADSCAALGLQLVFCSPADDNPDDCPPLSCDCGGTQLSFGQGCMSDKCLAAISCDAVCAPDTDAPTRAFLCLFNGVCKGDADCKAGDRCLVNPGDTSGECSSRGVGAACFEDADCLSNVCVVAADASRSCGGSGVAGAVCNRDDQCVAGFHCVLPAGAFAGLCTNGRDATPCLTDADCQSLLSCVDLAAAGHLCSARSPGSLCDTDADCDGSFCVAYKCASGAVGAPCTSASQCRVPFCTNGACSAGAPGDACSTDADCQMTCVTGLQSGRSVCSDGKLGSACSRDVTPCVAGLRCATSGASSVCTGPGPVGAICAQDTDCVSKKCGGLAGAPGAVCTDGQRGQRCHDAQCVAGLHCISDGLAGVCVAGAEGDPCHAPQDCLGGACLPTPAPVMSPCPGVPDFGACGLRGVCINGDCFPQTCGPVGDGGASDAGD